MKKTLKLSLVAAVAVAGISSVASAKPLSEAIKNTDLSGYIRYRYTNGEGSTESNEYKAVFVTKSKVNDKVTAKLKYVIAGATTNKTGDADVGVQGNKAVGTNALKEANFIMELQLLLVSKD